MSDPHVLVVRRDDDRFPNLEAFIDYLRKHGKEVKSTTPNRNDDDHLASLMFMRALDLEATFIAAGGSSPECRNQLMAGYIDFHFNNTLVFQGYVGKDQPLKVLAVLWPERVAKLDPEAPTVEEVTGKKVVSAVYRGFAASSKASKERIEKLRESYEKAMKDPEFLKEAEKRRLPLGYINGEDYTKLLYKTQEMTDMFFGKNK
jgi:tripartite-type tricarboxylate transporter receptor subunit TctC